VARLYTNENVSHRVAERLRDRGHDVETVAEKGFSARPDEDVLAHALDTQRIIVTHNRRHFKALHNTCPDHFGILICSADADHEALAERIHACLQHSTPLVGKLVLVDKPSK